MGEKELVFPIEFIRVLEVHLIAGGWHRFVTTVDSPAISTRRRKTYVYNGNELTAEANRLLTAKANAAGLMTRHLGFYQPDRVAASRENASKQAARYVPVEVPNVVKYKYKLNKKKAAKKAPRATPGCARRVARGSKPEHEWPGHALVEHHPLHVGMEVFAIDLGGDWYRGSVSKIVGEEATIRFDFYSKAEDVTHRVNSPLIRYRVPPPAPLQVAAAAAAVVVHRNRPLFDLNYTSSSSDDDEFVEDDENVQVSALATAPAAIEEEPEVITEPETDSEDDVEDVKEGA